MNGTKQNRRKLFNFGQLKHVNSTKQLLCFHAEIRGKLIVLELMPMTFPCVLSVSVFALVPVIKHMMIYLWTGDWTIFIVHFSDPFWSKHVTFVHLLSQIIVELVGFHVLKRPSPGCIMAWDTCRRMLFYSLLFFQKRYSTEPASQRHQVFGGSHYDSDCDEPLQIKVRYQTETSSLLVLLFSGFRPTFVGI